MAEEVIISEQSDFAEGFRKGNFRIEIVPHKVEQSKSESQSIERAKQLFGRDFLAREAAKKTWGVDIPEDKIPDFEDQHTPEVLARAKELGMMLMLRYNLAPDGTPLTMKKMEEMLQPKFDEQPEKGKIFDVGSVNRFRTQAFFATDTPIPRWALVSKDVIPGSTSRNYLEQTQAVADYLQDVFFKDISMPPKYSDAIKELRDQKAEIQKIIEEEKWEKAAEKLANLQLNKLTRRTPVEVLYDFLMRKQNGGERMLERKYDWTNVRSSSGGLVGVGYFDSGGAVVGGWHPDGSSPNVGLVLSL